METDKTLCDHHCHFAYCGTNWGFTTFSWSLGQSSWCPVLHGLGWAWNSVCGYRRGIYFVWEFKMLWWIQVVLHLDHFIHFPLDTVWIHEVGWCLHHWWLLCSVQLPCSTESATEIFRQLRWDSFSSVSESKEKRVAILGLVFRRI